MKWQRWDFDLGQGLRRNKEVVRLVAALALGGVVGQLVPGFKASRVGRNIRATEFPIPARHLVPLFRPDRLGAFPNITLADTGIVTGDRQA